MNEIMRMWMTKPDFMCDKHLLGEHAECHMLAANLLRKRKITNYIKFNLLEPKSLHKRHNQLAEQMKKRNFKHNSPLPDISIEYLPDYQKKYSVNTQNSLKDLLGRSPRCRKKYRKLK